MALPLWVQGARSPSLLLTWYQEGTTVPVNLTGATITARISRSEAVEAVTGDFELVDASNGVFRWDLSEVDVAQAGAFSVQFTASFGGGPSPAKTFEMPWRVEPSLAE